MRFARLVITAATDAWALEAARSATGFATSVIGCKCEAAIERPPRRRRDPRRAARDRGAAVRDGPRGRRQARARPRRPERHDLPDDRVLRRARRTPRRRSPMGKSLRYFGDGFQASKVIAGERFWRIPVMEGEFLVAETVGVGRGVGGGNLVIGAARRAGRAGRGGGRGRRDARRRDRAAVPGRDRPQRQQGRRAHVVVDARLDQPPAGPTLRAQVDGHAGSRRASARCSRS